MSSLPTSPRIALMVFGGIGDVILFSPVLDMLRRARPDAHLTLLLEDRSRSVVDLLPSVDAVLPLNVQGQSRPRLFWQILSHLRAGRFDAGVSTGTSPFLPLLLAMAGIPVRVGFQAHRWGSRWLTHPAVYRPQAYASVMHAALAQALLGAWGLPAPLDVEAARPVVSAPAAPIDLLPDALKAVAGRKKILLHPGVSRASVAKNILKAWPPAHWAALIRQLATPHDVFLAGGPDDAESIAAILAALEAPPGPPPQFHTLYGQTKSLSDLAALIQAADLMVCVDSAPMHLAVGLGTPIVAMFGPTDPQKLLPAQDPRCVAVTQPDLACRPCLFDVRRDSCSAPVCLEVSVEAMAQAVEQGLLSRETSVK